jgi:DNA-binding NarL/FixJ family response regulator
MTVRVMVVDDQALIRDGLMTLLTATPDLEPVAAASNGEEAVALAAEHRPDVILMDLRMPLLDGVGATAQIRAAHPEIEVVVLTTHADDASILSALNAGARGYLTKDAGMAEIRRAVQAAAAGQAVLDPVVQTRLLAAASHAGAPAPALASSSPSSPTSGPLAAPSQGTADPNRRSEPQAANDDDLTPRELEVLALIAAGKSNAEIAATLFVSAATVKTHINHVFSKIGARDRAQAVHYAYTHGLAR